MPINILSWNIKAFVGCVSFGGNRLTILEQVMNAFDLIFIYEVPNTGNGTTCLTNFVTGLNAVGARVYNSLSVATGGLGKENDRIGVVFETNTVTVADTTAARLPNGFAGRAPAYFDVTEVATGTVKEFCAWHAPEPTNAPQLIAQGWQNILRNSMDQDRNALTAVIVGDFNNGNLVVPRRGNGRQFARQIGANVGTTLQPNLSSSNLATTIAYRTNNTYDQFYTDANLLTAVGAAGVYDVMNRLVTNAAPLTGLFGNAYNTPQRAYQLYNGRLSDHLPVAITLTF